MRTRLVPLAVLALLFVATEGFATSLYGKAFVEIVDDQHVVTVQGCLWLGIPEGFVGIVVECRAVGVCADAFFYPETPASVEFAELSWECNGYRTTITVDPPHPEATCMYTPYWVDEQGNRTPTVYYCDADSRTYALAMTDETPVTRGTLFLGGNDGTGILFRVKPCADGCWLNLSSLLIHQDELESMVGLPWTELLGRPLDVYGDRTGCGMPGDSGFNITSMALAPEGLCGPVPVSQTSWDGLKAMYR